MKRDSQRSKVYAAERVIEKGVRGGSVRGRYDLTPGGEVVWFTPMSIEECQAMVDKVLASPYTARKFPKRIDNLRRHGIHVEYGKGGGQANIGYDGPVIRLGVWARQPSIILHEMAHLLVGLHHQHDHEFAAGMLTLVRFFMGAEEGDKLKASYRDHKVRFRPKRTRTITPEQRQAAIDRLAMARATKAAKAQEAEAARETEMERMVSALVRARGEL